MTETKPPEGRDLTNGNLTNAKKKFFVRLFVAYEIHLHTEAHSIEDAEQAAIEHYYKIANREYEAKTAHSAITKIEEHSAMFQVKCYPERAIGVLK